VSEAVVRKSLGDATARLWCAVNVLLERVSAAPPAIERTASRVALSQLALQVLCGRYHDFRSAAPLPKADLIVAIRELPPHDAIDADRQLLVDEVIRGAFADGDDEAARYAASVVNKTAVRRQPPPPRQDDPITLTPKQYRVFVWLYRHMEVYGVPPTLAELADGIEETATSVHSQLKSIAKRGAVVNLGGPRGWFPLRAP
jgi:hypothetical protein